MGRLALNMYLLKDGVTDPYSVINVGGLSRQLSVPLGSGNDLATLHYGEVESNPEWFGVLSQQATATPIPQLTTKAASGLLLCLVNSRWFVISFGHGWQKVQSDSIETNFGIKCVLNLCEKNSLRAIRRDRVTDDFIQAIEQIPDEDNIYRFGIDVDRDLLRGVKARIPENLNFGTTVVGSDSFKAEIDLSAETLHAFLSRCHQLYVGNQYKQKFSWVDNVSAVRDSILIGDLDKVLTRAVGLGVTSLTMCVPVLLSWDDFDSFAFQKTKRGQAPIREPLTLNQWRASTQRIRRRVQITDLKDSYVFAYKQGEAGIQGKWPVFECIHGVVTHKKQPYLAHGGQWFKLSQDFVDEIELRVSKISNSGITLPTPLLSQTEGQYNVAAAQNSGGTLLYLDKQNVMFGGGRSRIEICDLLTTVGQIICVKPWGGASASLSHLFQQALVAAQLIVESSDFRQSAVQQITNNFLPAWDSVCSSTTETEIVLAILRGPKKEALPFFAKVALVSTVSGLKRMRFNPTYLAL